MHLQRVKQMQFRIEFRGKLACIFRCCGGIRAEVRGQEDSLDSDCHVVSPVFERMLPSLGWLKRRTRSVTVFPRLHICERAGLCLLQGSVSAKLPGSQGAPHGPKKPISQRQQETDVCL